MARIRSVHPGLFTDEAFMALTLPARLLAIGLWTEADDQGIFEWKPLTLKARIFPVDAIDVSVILGELATANMVRSYEIEGRQYGAIRNFRKFQRPKSPNATHPIPSHFRNYVGLSADIAEKPPDEPKSFPPKGEKSPQMEDGGGRRKEITNGSAPHLGSAREGCAAPEAEAIRIRQRLVALFGENEKTMQWQASTVGYWLAKGYTESQIMLVAEDVKAKGIVPGSLNYFTPKLEDGGKIKAAEPENDPFVEAAMRRRAETPGPKSEAVQRWMAKRGMRESG